MSLTESTVTLNLGASAPGFSLPSTEGDLVGLEDFAQARLLVVLFICNHCPYVIHIAPTLARLAARYRERGVGFVAINSNDTEAYPADSFDLMKVEKEKRGYTFPYLYDESQQVAKAYDAACTPDIYVFDGDRKLAYHGQFDSSRPYRISSGNYDSSRTPATGEDLASALDRLLAGQPAPETQYPCMGCNIKWR